MLAGLVGLLADSRGRSVMCLLIQEVVYYLALHRNLHLNCSVSRL